MPKVSIIIPSYNHHQWIAEAFDSILQQSYQDFEIIAIDDGSSDNSPEIIRDYSAHSSRIRGEFFPQNQGACKAINQAIRLAKGEYIALLNSDDLWLPDKLEKQVHVLDENPGLGAVFGLASPINEHGHPLDKSELDVFAASVVPRDRYEWMRYFLLKGNCVCHPTILIRKECYDHLGDYDPTLRSLPDLHMWVRLFYHYDIKVMNEPLVKFRLHRYNESNINSIANKVRGQFEWQHIFRTMLGQIKSVEEFERIFPGIRFPVRDYRLVPVYFALIVKSKPEKFAKAFALNTLQSLLQQHETASLMEQYGIYSTLQLSVDVAEADIYRYVDCGF